MSHDVPVGKSLKSSYVHLSERCERSLKVPADRAFGALTITRVTRTESPAGQDGREQNKWEKKSRQLYKLWQGKPSRGGTLELEETKSTSKGKWTTVCNDCRLRTKVSAFLYHHKYTLFQRVHTEWNMAELIHKRFNHSGQTQASSTDQRIYLFLYINIWHDNTHYIQMYYKLNVYNIDKNCDFLRILTLIALLSACQCWSDFHLDVMNTWQRFLAGEELKMWTRKRVCILFGRKGKRCMGTLRFGSKVQKGVVIILYVMLFYFVLFDSFSEVEDSF